MQNHALPAEPRAVPSERSTHAGMLQLSSLNYTTYVEYEVVQRHDLPTVLLTRRIKLYMQQCLGLVAYAWDTQGKCAYCDVMQVSNSSFASNTACYAACVICQSPEMYSCIIK